jgi:hypothetical protein
MGLSSLILILYVVFKGWKVEFIKVINQLDEYVNLSSLPWPDNYKFNNRIAFQIISRENLIFYLKLFIYILELFWCTDVKNNF